MLSPDKEQFRAVCSKTCPPSEAARENEALESVEDDNITTSNSRKRHLVLSSCGPLLRLTASFGFHLIYSTSW